MNFSEKDRDRHAEIGKNLIVMERLLCNNGYIKKADLQAYCDKHSSGGITPTNTSITHLIDLNDHMSESLLHLLIEKDLILLEEFSNSKMDADDNTELDRQKALEMGQRIDGLFDYLRFIGLITHSDMKNSFRTILAK